MATMSRAASRSFDDPDERAEKGGVRIEVVHLGDLKVKRATYPAGWHFAEHMGADRCPDTHVGYVVSGRIRARWDDGTEIQMESGHVFTVPAGHDAWCDEECTIVQFDEGDSAAHRFGLS